MKVIGLDKIIGLTYLAVVVICSLACGKVDNPQFQVQMHSIWAKEGAKKWDLFDEKPELFYIIKNGDREYKSNPSSSGSWRIDFNPDENIHTVALTGEYLDIAVFDDDLGDDNDFSGDSESLITDILFSLANDADDLVLKTRVQIEGEEGVKTIENSKGGFVLEYKRIK